MSRFGLVALFPLGILGLVGCPNSLDDVTDDSHTDTDPTGIGNIVVDPCEVDFGIVEPGGVETQSISLQNTGDGPLEVISIGTAEPFSVTATTPITVMSGSTYQFSLQFKPGADDFGSFSDSLTIESDDQDSATVTCNIIADVTSDSDGDGYVATLAGGDDCDDDNPEINPGMPEQWYDGVDSDCSGTSDFDQDGDGYESDVFNDTIDPDCDPMTEVCGGDCQDVDTTIHPGAEDTWYDGVDSNCSGGSDFDQDEDGYRSAAYGYDDCDDFDPDVNPDGLEAFNRKDDDCNGVIDDQASADEADIIAIGASDDRAAGNSVAMGDWDGTASVDIAVGVALYDYTSTASSSGDGQGAVAIFWDNAISDFDEFETDADVYIEGASSTDEFGTVVINVGDFDADGVDDLGVSAVMASSRAGKVYVFSGALIDAVTDTSEALVEIEGVDDYQIGANLSSEIDLDGDGDYDLFAWGTNSYLPELTLAVVYGGSGVSGTYSWSDIDATWRFSCGESSGTGTPTCGSPVTGATGADYGGTDTFVYGGQAGADVDGDGYHDVIAGDKFNDDSGYKQSGRVWGLWGKASEYSQFNATLNSTATVLAEGSSVKHYIGGMVGASSDMDGDGDSELWIYNGKAEALYFFEGGSHLKSGSLDLSAPDATFEDITKEITAISNPGDWTGDGIDDIAISFSGSDAGSSGGAIWLYESKAWSGTYDASAAISGSIEGSDYNGNFGWGTAQVAKDLDGNGSADLLAGDYAYDEDDDGAEGSLHIFYNGL